MIPLSDCCKAPYNFEPPRCTKCGNPCGILICKERVQNESDKAVFDLVVQRGCFAADAIALAESGYTTSEQTELVVRRALEALVVNGMIKIVAREP